MDQVADRGAVRRDGDRRQPGVEAHAVALEGEGERTGVRCQPEAVKHLGRVEVRRQAQPERRLVVVWHERPHRLFDLGQRSAAHRDEPGAKQVRASDLTDHVRSVRERVEPDGVHVQEPPIGRVERKDAGVTVPYPGKRREPHQPGEELVAVECIGMRREVLDRRVEACGGEVVEQIRMVVSEVRGQQADVAGAVGASIRRKATGEGECDQRPRGEADHRFLRSFASTSSAQASDARTRA